MGLALQDIQRGDGGAGIGGGQAHAEHQAGAQEAHVFDQAGIAGDIAAAGGQGLGQGAHVDVDGFHRQAGAFADAAAGISHDAEAVGFVHHQQHVMLLLDLDQAGQVQDLAIHGIDAFGHDEAAAEAGAFLFQKRIQRVPVAILVGEGLGARQACAGDDAVVGAAVIDDGVRAGQQVRDDAHIGEIAADEDQRVVGAQEVGQLAFQLAMQLDLAGHDAAGGRRGAELVHRVLGGGGDGGVAVQAQVIVAGKADQALAVPADDAVADAVAGGEEGDGVTAGLQVFDAATQRAIAGKVIHHALALGQFGFGRNDRLFGGRRMGRHCPSD